MSLSGAKLAQRSRAAALIATILSLVAAPSAASAIECPDPATVSAAQLIEFKTMMLAVGLRCKYVGVMMEDHNEDMAVTRVTMFEEASGRVRRYISANDRPASVQTAAGAGAKGPVVKGKAPATARPRALVRALAKTPPKALAKAPAKALVKAPAKAPAPRSRHDDPYDKYLTRVWQSYGMGDNTLGTCRKFDAVVLALADRTTPSRTLTMAAAAMIGSPLLEKQAACSSQR